MTLTTTSDPGVISVHTNSLSDVNTHNARLKVKLTNYAAVAAVEIAFTITITNPCFSTSLTLPTTLTAVTITSKSGTGNDQTFLPATTAGVSASIPGLCGVRVYSIDEAIPANFVTITAPAGDQYVDSWTLSCLSNNLSDVGVHTVTLRVVLQDYSGITAATKTV